MCVNGDTGKDNIHHTADYTFSLIMTLCLICFMCTLSSLMGGILSETKGLHEILTEDKNKVASGGKNDCISAHLSLQSLLLS